MIKENSNVKKNVKKVQKNVKVKDTKNTIKKEKIKKNVNIEKKQNLKSTAKKNVKKTKAFTLIEIIAVIIIIGIIALIAVTSVSQYINDASNTTYMSYENAMKGATANRVTDCIGGNIYNDECILPNPSEKNIVFLNDLIAGGYIDELKDPEGDGYCDSNLSYVEIYNEDTSNYTYTACLYCGEYSTENATCKAYTYGDDKKDGDTPICGEQTPNTTKWTNINRTITVGCTDETSGCVKSSFSKTFNKTTKESEIVIRDNSGETTTCSVNVFVDKTAPTCELEIISGNEEATGWYSGEVKVQLKNQKDEDSGILTYGIGTSIKERNYNKETTMTLKEGMTSVIGYVKDTAGNEGLCSIDVRVGTEKPQFDFRYGYQIYPNKEKYTVSNMTESGTTFKSTSTDPQISFTGLEKYTNVDKVIIYFNDAIASTTTGKIFYSNGTNEQSSSAIILKGSKQVEFNLQNGSYQNMRIVLGTLNNASYNIKKIELNTKDGGTFTNKDVAINITPIDRGARTIGYSYDNASTFISNSTKLFSKTNENKIVTKNEGQLTSDAKLYSIGGYDSVIPTVKFEAIKNGETTLATSGNWSDKGLSFKVTQNTVGISGAKIYYCKDTTDTCNPTTEIASGTTISDYLNETGTYYIRYITISNAGSSSPINSFKAMVDTTTPTVNILATEKSSGTTVSPSVWQNEGINFKLTQDIVGPSGAKIYYCKDTTNTCEPTTVVSTGSLINAFNTTEGQYYFRYKIVSNAGLTSGVKSFDARTDTVSPTVKLEARKQTSGTAVTSGSWSSEGLLFKLTQQVVGKSGAKIYYCQDTTNTCEPNQTTTSGIDLSNFTSLTSTYYIRYKIVSNANLESTVASYTAKVDTTVPTATMSATKATSGTSVLSGVWSTEGLNYKITQNSVGPSNAIIYYCEDTTNTCTPSTIVTSGTSITSYKATEGTYYIRYKILSGSGLSSTYSYKAQVDTKSPTVSIAAKQKTSGTAIASNSWSTQGLNITFTQNNAGSSGATIYYCKDTANSCNPTTVVTSGTAITTYNTTEGTYYIRYKITSGAGYESPVTSYTAKVDTVVPNVSLAVTKVNSGAANATNTWSNEGLHYLLTATASGSSGTIITYCKDTTNTCTPSTVIASGSKVTSYASTQGTYYFRYKITNGAGVSTSVASYTAKVDTVAPTMSITAKQKTSGTAITSGSWSTQGLDITLTAANTGSSGYTIYYCQDTANTCTPSTKATSGTAITTYNTTEGTYYIRYKIVNGMGIESAVGSYTAKVDTVNPTVTLTAKKKSAGTAVASGTWSSEGLNFTLTAGNTGKSGYTIYYCQDTTNTCTPSTKATSSTAITTYNTTEGTYYFRYYIQSGSGTKTAVTSYTAKVDSNTPTVTLTAKKKSAGTAVTSGNWSNEGLNFTLTGNNAGPSGQTLYYCQDTANTCTPTTVATSGTAITSFNTATGTYYIRYYVKTGSGKTTSVASYTSKIDTSSPTVSVSITKATSGTAVSSGTWSNEGVNIKFTQSGAGVSGAVIYYCKDTANTCTPTTIASSGTNITAYNTLTGTYYVRYYIASAAGNKTSVASISANVDKTAPTCTATAGSTAWTNGSVALTVTPSDTGGSGVKGTDWTSNKKTVTANGTYTATVTDNAGNTGKCSVSVSNIETTKPTCTVSASPSGWTGGNVTLTVTPSDTGGSGVKGTDWTNNKKTVTANGTYTATVTDNAGNTNTCSGRAYIDPTNPTCTISASTTAWTNGDVVLTVTPSDTGGSGVKGTDWTNNKKTVSTNGTYTATVTDNAGRTGTCSIKVSNIDKTKPTCSLSVTSGTAGTSGWYTSNVTVTASFSDTGGSGVSNKGTAQSSTVSYNSATTSSISSTTSGTTVYCFVKDAAGNTNSSSTTIKVDKEDPKCSVSVSTSGVSFSATQGGSPILKKSLTNQSTGASSQTSLALAKANFKGEVTSQSGRYASCGKTVIATTKTYNKTTQTCTKTHKAYTKYTTTCNKSISGYTTYTRKCTPTYSWGPTSTTTVTTCTASSPSCNYSNVGAVYKTCSAYTYKFSISTTTITGKCTSQSSISCKEANYGKSYYSCTYNSSTNKSTKTTRTCTRSATLTSKTCNTSQSFGSDITGTSPSVPTTDTTSCTSATRDKSFLYKYTTNYNYYTSTASATVTSCPTIETAITCNASNSGNVGKSYVSSCTETFNYANSAKTENGVASCTTGTAVGCDNTHVGNSYVSACTPVYSCSAGTKLNDTYCYY